MKNIVRKLLTGLSATALVLTGVMAIGSPASASVIGDDYPAKWRNVAQDTVVDDWSEWNRECTSFVAWRLHSQNGFEMPFHDNAGLWKVDAQNLGYIVNTSPAVGAVAWNSGHVGWVADVPSSTTVTIEDYNHYISGSSGPVDGAYHVQTVATSTYQYIHFKDIPNTLPTATYQPFSGDFNGDKVGDIGLRDSSNGIFYFKTGTDFASNQSIYQWAAGTNYQAFAGDFNGDGIGDIGLRDSATGGIYFKLGPNYADNQSYYPWAAGSDYQIIVGDFNGDGLDDIGLRDASTGGFYFKTGPDYSTNQSYYPWAAGTNYRAIAGDFNGDGTDDIGLFDTGNGYFYFKSGPNFANNQSVYPWAAGTNYQPFVGDFNGDGIDDIGLRNSTDGGFFFKLGPNYSTNQSYYPWAAG